MGTNHMIGVVANNEFKVAQYGQWDGYPSGQGINVLEFLINNDLERFKKKISQCEWIEDEQYVELWKSFEVDLKVEKFVDSDIADKFYDRYPQFNRSTGSNILKMIYDSYGLKLKNSSDFVNYSLFCEWAYIIDFDKNTFEIYKGFNKEPLDKNERFYNGNNKQEYYPVRLLKLFDINALPTEDEFLAICESKFEE